MVKRNGTASTRRTYNHSNVDTSRPINQLNSQIPTYDWDEITQQMLLGAFYYGKAAMEIPGGILTVKTGGKHIISFAIILTSLIAAFSPLAAGIHVGLLLTLRILDGIAQGMITPAIYTLLTKWADPDKRSKMISIVYVGKAIGAIVSNYTSAWICSSYKIGGWPMSYYIYSMFGAVLAIIWITGVSESPDQDTRKSQTITPNKTIPLYDILTSKPVWAIAIAKFASNFGYYFLLIEAPTLFSTILGVDVRTIGYLTLIPNCTIVVTGLLFAAAADYIIQQKYLSILNTRKLFVLLGFGISSACFCALVFSGHSVVVVEVLYIVISAVYGCNYASVLPNPMDITIEYSGVVTGVTQTIVSCSGFLLPIVIGLVINEENSLKQWILLFLITGGVQLFGMFFFLIFAEAEQQEWSSNNEEEKRSLINRK